MTPVKTGLIAIIMLLSLGAAAMAASLQSPAAQSFTVRAVGAFASLEYSALGSYDQASFSYQAGRERSFVGVGGADLAGHDLAAQLRSGAGQAHVLYDPDASPLAGNATITGCSGFLAFLCGGGTQIFDIATQTISSFSTNSWVTTLSVDGLVHRSDRAVNWTSGNTSFFNSGGAEAVRFSVSSLDIDVTPVPLPAGFALLLGGLALLGSGALRARFLSS